MNLKIRTLSAIDCAMPKSLLIKRIGLEWREGIVMSVYKAIKGVERDARRIAINDCATLAYRPYGDAVAALAGEEPQAVGNKIGDAILGLLEKKRSKQPRRRTR